MILDNCTGHTLASAGLLGMGLRLLLWLNSVFSQDDTLNGRSELEL